MAIPDYQEIMLPLLELSADGQIHTLRGMKDTLAERFSLTSEEVTEMLPSGQQTKFHNRIGWAKTYLKGAGLLDQVRRGHFQISPRGREVLQSRPACIDNDFLSQFSEFQEFKGRFGTNGGRSERSVSSETPGTGQTPEEAFQAAYEQMRSDLTSELLEEVRSQSSEFFEKLVLELMLAMGYGGPQNKAALTSGGADGGIDGIINEDRLGLDIIYLQAKRWEAQVGRPEIQKFVGALHGKRARKGVFMTTSTFSRDAYEYAETIDSKVVLVDGRLLAQYMIDYNVGVSTEKSYVVKRIDSDYFVDD